MFYKKFLKRFVVCICGDGCVGLQVTAGGFLASHRQKALSRPSMPLDRYLLGLPGSCVCKRKPSKNVARRRAVYDLQAAVGSLEGLAIRALLLICPA